MIEILLRRGVILKFKRILRFICFILISALVISFLKRTNYFYPFKVLLFIWIIQLIFIPYYLLTEFLIPKININIPFYSKELLVLNNVWFPSNYKFPKDRLLFQKSESNSCAHSKLPLFDFNDYDFFNTSIVWCKFHEKTNLPYDRDFFQKIRNKSIQGVTLPEGDYSLYNFKDVNLRNAKFTDNSILPADYNLFQYSNSDLPLRVKLPKSCAETIHHYNFTGVDLQLIDKLTISTEQYMLLSKQLSQESMRNSFVL